MEPKITGGQFIDYLSLDNFLHVIEQSDIRTIRNWCITSKDFRYWCQTQHVQNIIKRKLREEATWKLINFLYTTENDAGCWLSVKFPNGTYQIVCGGDHSYYIRNKDETLTDPETLNENSFINLITTSIQGNYPITLTYTFYNSYGKLQEGYMYQPGISQGPGPNLGPDFINNTGVQYVPTYLNISPTSHVYKIQITPQEFIEDYVRKNQF